MPVAHPLQRAARRLISAYPTDGWWPSGSRFETMLGAVLVQNTRWQNVERALHQLRRLKLLEPKRIGACPEARLIALLQPAGCQRVKARRVLALARWVIAEGGTAVLARRGTASLRAGLLGVHGVGPETADAMLCFAFAWPVFIADRYALRWFGRMGWEVPGSARRSATDMYEAVRQWAEAGIAHWPAADCQSLHAAVVLHAQAVCAPEPVCNACPVARQCKKSI